jgi:hypothetical protein
MTLEIDPAEVEAVGTGEFPAIADKFGTAAVLVRSMQEDHAAIAMFNSDFLAAWVDHATQLTLFLKQSEANLDVCGETLAAMAREIAAVDAENGDEIEAGYRDRIDNPGQGSYQEAADLD